MLAGCIGNSFIAKYVFSGLLCGISLYPCRYLRYLDTSICIVKEILVYVQKSIFVSMNEYLHPKVFGLGEEILSNIDPVKGMNVQE